MSFLAPNATASPTPSNASSTGQKRKRPAPAASIHSNLGNGGGPHLSEGAAQLKAQVHFAVTRLKSTDKAVSFQDLIDYLSISDPGFQERLRYALPRHDQIEFNPKGFNGAGSYRFRPKHNVRSGEDLKAYFQKQKVSLGLNAKELKEGWPGAWDAINELDKKGDLLVIRNKKENTPKYVWQNDPTLSAKIDAKFCDQWHTIALPANPDELRSKLEAAGLKPTSAPREGLTGPKVKERKKKAARKSGRQTNTHMAGILRDYSHKRK
ncbi:transcription initiation factor IIE, beta subunit [Pseudovirgaria hyperparasitica]|uniref:Transcription initiation factor IIE subunit beta n=1 Tax=Pseudovirgaria hyperparasitica TaxID=470096 RepID=A0A6A6VYH2_9PEZI|nr:transcription initiation factor IIE, beta subunit [Pseudovirgaria hyperparasitica]KAF2754876.1 transcription initiation factor IIE, beta subunit [Pseudovirgaria hyperparasitica]